MSDDDDALRIDIVQQPGDSDIADAMSIMQPAFPPEYGEAWSAAQLRSMMQLPGALLVIGRVGTVPVGFALLRSIVGEAELLLLAVHPDRRGRNHGRRLLDRCMSEAEGSGAQTMFLEVRSGNPAMHLYSKAGFHQYNLRHNYYVGNNGERFHALSFKIILGQR